MCACTFRHMFSKTANLLYFVSLRKGTQFFMALHITQVMTQTRSGKEDEVRLTLYNTAITFSPSRYLPVSISIGP